MYLITLFRIDSEIKIQDAISQEIDIRVLKSLNSFSDAQDYLYSIKNSTMMYNFPFAMIQQMEKKTSWYVLDQKLYLLDEVYMRYDPLDDLEILTMCTRRKLHDFNEAVELAMHV